MDGILRNAPPTTDIISEQKFWNFALHVEFRIVEHSNSGIGLRGRYEIQILEDYGKPPDTHGAAALYSRVAPAVNASKPAGEWQSYDIRLVGRTLTVVHNGTKVLDKVEVEGLTAIANNADEAEPGPFIVQGDHSYVEIKSFVVTPLVKKLTLIALAVTSYLQLVQVRVAGPHRVQIHFHEVILHPAGLRCREQFLPIHHAAAHGNRLLLRRRAVRKVHR